MDAQLGMSSAEDQTLRLVTRSEDRIRGSPGSRDGFSITRDLAVRKLLQTGWSLEALRVMTAWTRVECDSHEANPPCSATNRQIWLVSARRVAPASS